MTEKLNTSNISTLATSIVEETGIRNIANGVTNRPIAKTLVQQWGTDPNGYTKKIHSMLESTLNCKINERVNSSFVFFRWEMPSISEVASRLAGKKDLIIKTMQEAMTVADPKDIQDWIMEVMVCTAKQSALTERDMALKAKVYASKLSHIPADILRDACHKICLNSKFFPSLAEIYQYVEPKLYYRKSLVELISGRLIASIGDK